MASEYRIEQALVGCTCVGDGRGIAVRYRRQEPGNRVDTAQRSVVSVFLGSNYTRRWFIPIGWVPWGWEASPQSIFTGPALMT